MAPKVSPKQERDWFWATAAELRAFQLFSPSFLTRHAGAELFSQKDYTYTRHVNKPELNRVLSALQQDFMNGLEANSLRKPDGLGISRQGDYAELMEVKTVGGKVDGKQQLDSMLDILRRRVNVNWNLHTAWSLTNWRPVGAQLFYEIGPNVILSFEPTYREAATPGVILYEVFDLRRKQEQPVQLPLASDIVDVLRRRVRERLIKHEGPVGWAEAFGHEHPLMLPAVKAVCLLAGSTLAILGLILILDPIPGDELLTLSAAVALVAFARDGSIAQGYRSTQ